MTRPSRTTLVLLAIAIILLDGALSSVRAADPPSPAQAAQQAAESWLRLTDSRPVRSQLGQRRASSSRAR